MPAVPVVLVALVALVVPVVWASASVSETANPNAAANARSETFLRRETILNSTSEVMFKILPFEGPGISSSHLLTTLI